MTIKKTIRQLLQIILFLCFFFYVLHWLKITYPDRPYLKELFAGVVFGASTLHWWATAKSEEREDIKRDMRQRFSPHNLRMLMIYSFGVSVIITLCAIVAYHLR